MFRASQCSSSGMPVLTGIPSSHLNRLIIPDDVLIHFDLLMMSTVILETCKSEGVPRQAEVAQGVPGRLRPRIFLTFRHYKGGRSSVKRTGRLHPRKNPWYSRSAAESTSGHMVLSRVPRKKSPVTPPESIPGPSDK